MVRVKDALQRRVVAPVKQQLLQGVTPGKLALSLALGVVVSVMPLLGVTTVVALALSVVLRLNAVAMVAANYAAYPLQILLFIPFFQLGAWITNGRPVPFTLEQIRTELAAGVWPTVVRYADANTRALGAWLVLAPLATWLLYFVFRKLLERLPLPRTDEAPPAP
ncbi:MAG TPA: DUF2062 domain-containing protein [Anaeromyxobacteraceae bacterium]|nr:DUF2062 domain-containing protein [Anaeromyxobacteraceae bacterium]